MVFPVRVFTKICMTALLLSPALSLFIRFWNSREGTRAIIMAALADTGEYTADDASREENLRIFQALAGLRRAGIRSSQSADGPSHRTWGTLCTAYEEQQEARLHAVLRPFLYTGQVDGRPPLVARVARALERIGVLPLCGGDVFEVVGATKGDGAQRIQIFADARGQCLEEYLLLS